LICPKCGEDNAENFRFCGMCGTVLEARPEIRRPAGAPVPNLPKMTSAAEPARSATVETANDLPSPDSLRQNSFSGLDSFFEPEEPKSGRGRLFLLLVLLAALGAAGWWTYTNYLASSYSQKPEAAQPTPATGSAAPTAETPPTPPPAAAASAVSSKDANASPAVSQPSENSPAAPIAKAAPVIPRPTPAAEKRTPVVAPAKTLKTVEPAATDNGDAEFRRGEGYLYGRGAHANCDEAVKDLRAASAKNNAKARSTLGAMYDTGHCVARDLPTSYLWFALALRLDPNNQILQKDLEAVWNQMTPPERQMATRMKQ
jgi:hypothetical protein